MRIRTIGFIVTLALGLLAAPLPAEAQQAGKVYRIGFVVTGSPSNVAPTQASEGFRQALRKLGYVEGQNITIAYRGAELRAERFPGIMAELVRLQVDVIVVATCGAALEAARQATSTIPIVVAACNDDMVRSGVIASLARPGGNITGLSKLTPELAGKRLELLTEVVPEVSRVTVLWNPSYANFAADWQEMRAAARRLGVTLHPVAFRRPEDFDRAFAAMTTAHADALICFSDGVIYFSASRVADLAAKSRLPAIYPFREVPDAGGLMSYGPNITDLFRRAAFYVDKILRGAKPGNLPVEQPIKFDLVINLKTAKALGLTLPPTVLLQATKVIR